MPRSILKFWSVIFFTFLITLPWPGSPLRAGPDGERGRSGADVEKPPSRPLGPGGVGGQGVVTPVMLIKSAAVQEELGLTGRQKKEIADLNGRFDQRRLESARALTKGGRRADPSSLMAMIASLRAENEEALAKALEPGQRKRLGQIALQLEGPMAVAKPEIAVKVAMNPDQIEAVQEIINQYKQAQERLWQSRISAIKAPPPAPSAPPRDPPPTGRKADPKAKAKADKPARADEQEARGRALLELNDTFDRKSDALQDEAIRLIGRTLTRKQKAAFNKLLGEPFDLSLLQPGAARRVKDMPPDDEPAVLEPIPPDPRPSSGRAPERRGR